MDQNDKVIMFPKWRTTLEIESLEALKHKRYREALDKLNELITYQVKSHEIIVGKLICLMELGEYEEAMALCEEAINFQDENYYHYVHIYLTILFQMSNYQSVMEFVEIELFNDSIPKPVREQFQQLYDISSNMLKELNNKKTAQYLTEFKQSFTNNDYQTQWLLVEKMRKINADPTREMIALLADERTHPVVNTAIFRWLQHNKSSEKIYVQKMGVAQEVIPISIADIKEHVTIKQILLLLSEIEQDNPTLYHFLNQLLYRYAYVRYPLLPKSSNAQLIAEALKKIGHQYLHIHMPVQVKENDADYSNNRYIEEITLCEKLYLSILEE